MNIKDRIIDETLKIISAEKSSRSVSLREVARRVGCSAPNVYNHFSSLNDLLNKAMAKIISNYMQVLSEVMESLTDRKKSFEKSAEIFINWAMENEGWFYFFHFEQTEVELMKDTKTRADSTGQYMASLLMESCDCSMDMDRALHVTSVIRNYLLGELSQYITKRSDLIDRKEYSVRLITNCLHLKKLLSNDNEAK